MTITFIYEVSRKSPIPMVAYPPSTRSPSPISCQKRSSHPQACIATESWLDICCRCACPKYVHLHTVVHRLRVSSPVALWQRNFLPDLPPLALCYLLKTHSISKTWCHVARGLNVLYNNRDSEQGNCYNLGDLTSLLEMTSIREEIHVGFRCLEWPANYHYFLVRDPDKPPELSWLNMTSGQELVALHTSTFHIR